jgi:hypothetical protein
MNLQNSAQNKKFVADGVSVDKHASVATFYVQKKTRERSYPGTREFSTSSFLSRWFYGRNRADANSRKQSTDAGKTYPTSAIADVRSAHGSHKSADTHDFAGQRPFLEKGKSQKFLNRKNKPLTIEQVRELLNKNK